MDADLENTENSDWSSKSDLDIKLFQSLKSCKHIGTRLQFRRIAWDIVPHTDIVVKIHSFAFLFVFVK